VIPEDTPTEEADKQNTYSAVTDALYKLYLIATIVGVVVALVGLRFVYRQNKNIEQQLGIQKRSSRQWVIIGNWRQDWSSRLGVNVLELSFDITNPTPIPLRLDLVASKMNGDFNDERLATFLVPQNPHSCNFIVTLNEPQADLYRTKGWSSNAEVSVYFTDAFDNQWCQTLQCLMFLAALQEIVTCEHRTTMRRSSPDKPEES
jgi:hypothetical protein